MKVENPLLFPRLRATISARTTPAGRFLLIVLLVTGSVAGGVGNGIPLYLYAFLLLWLFVVDYFVGTWFRPKVSVERDLPSRCAAGARVPVVARVTNTGRRRAYDLTVSERMSDPPMRVEASPVQDTLDPGATVEVGYTLEPAQRGAYDFEGPRVASAFPFGLYLPSRKVDLPGRVLVYPRFRPLASIDLPASRKHQPGGLALVSQVGDSGEFCGNRDYRTGDRPRDIHHAAWARRGGAPVVREFQQEYLTRIALVADTFGEDLEAGISLGAAVADCLSRQEYVIDVFAAGPDLYHFQAGRSLAYLDDILDVLACVERCPVNPFEKLAPALQEELAQISTAVCVLLDWDEVRAAFVRSLEAQGVAAKTIVVRQKAPTLDPTGTTTLAGPITVLTPGQVEAGVETL
ncbi:MAG TPA: DUF58 domain-containing protein [Planctomycetota bacterium]|nr:DUF58 domain-containing protein [Planctomycetota bacterium]